MPILLVLKKIDFWFHWSSQLFISSISFIFHFNLHYFLFSICFMRLSRTVSIPSSIACNLMYMCRLPSKPSTVLLFSFKVKFLGILSIWYFSQPGHNFTLDLHHSFATKIGSLPVAMARAVVSVHILLQNKSAPSGSKAAVFHNLPHPSRTNVWLHWGRGWEQSYRFPLVLPPQINYIKIY